MPSAAPDILTYRYNGNMVYVTPATTYDEGIQYARQVFPELADVAPTRIVISVLGNVNQQRQLIRIGPMAWKSVVFARARFEVLDVTLVPDGPEIVVTDHDALPEYESVKEKNPGVDFLAPSRAPSPPRLSHVSHKDMPHNASRSRSRSPSPSRPSSNDSCSAVDWAKSLFGKRVRQ
ncbi:hypothetical protein C2E23DRAFT_744724 [Lenzites betulinus]|nr:hypothetical protein C2E23DRAFT_744724 [Lenzites betulinus]